MKVGIALGSNVGDRLAQLREARQYLLGLSSEQWHLQSPVYETEPVGCPAGSPAFLNAVIEIEYGGTPACLLGKLQAYEGAHGRDRTGGINAPRTIDLDILYCGSDTIATPELTIPHPRMVQRRFVLAPLGMIRADMIIPGTGNSVQRLLQELPAEGAEVRLLTTEW